MGKLPEGDAGKAEPADVGFRPPGDHVAVVKPRRAGVEGELHQLALEAHDFLGVIPGLAKLFFQFGALSGVTLKENTLNHAVIRFMDCCVQVENSDTNTRPYCQARDFLVKNKTGVEKIVLLHNRMNGIPYMDHNLIWRQSQKEKAWVKHYQDREAAGLGGIYCRRYMGVNYYSQDGIPR